jgi:uncharacterized LabA/DUF88 family protein
MQNRNAQIAVFIDIRVPDFCDKSYGWWLVRIVLWELHNSLREKKKQKFLLSVYPKVRKKERNKKYK